MLLVLGANLLWGQRENLSWASLSFRDGHWRSGPQEVVQREPDHELLSYYLTWDGAGDPDLSIRFLTGETGRWTSWQDLNPYVHNPGGRISALYFVPAGQVRFELRSRNPKLMRITVHFYRPGATGGGPGRPATPSGQRACPCPVPPLVQRPDWCPGGDCPPNPNPVFTDVTHLIVHHSDTPNAADDWPAVVRAIWNFHVNGNGWSDIGYNYLVDPRGVVYEGRGNDVLGAHFCGQNTNTLGVCVLGDFTAVAPSLQARLVLAELLAWKTCDIGADALDSAFHAPSGLNLPHISGHRDGCATSCPGDQFYPLLPDLRQYVNDWIAAGCNALLGPILLAGEEEPAGTAFLQWADNSSIPALYELQRAEASDSAFSTLLTLPADAVSFSDTGLMASTAYGYRLRAFDGPDTSAWSNAVWVQTEPTSGLHLLRADAGLELFPNPVRHRLRVQWRGVEPEALQLANAQGQILWRRRGIPGRGTFELSVADLPAGYYVVQLLAGGRIRAQRPLIKR